MGKYLAIMEVSQKQAYIFGSNKVADNIVNSAIIAKCLSPEYIKEALGGTYDEPENFVYSGGGHTVLEFDDREKAMDCVFRLTEKIYKDFRGLSVFAKIREYQESKSPKENLILLSAELEEKKAMRKAGFRHGTFGIEQIDVNTLKPKSQEKYTAISDVKDEEYSEASKSFTPDRYEPVFKFEDLGGEKNSSNFIAIVHIDGNGMGKRVDSLYDYIENKNDWNSVKRALKDFSECIDNDFKNSYKEMTGVIADSLDNGELKGKLNLRRHKESGKLFFPIRRIITAGDDICFVTEGRIGLECARIFIEKLSEKKNKVDGKPYAACAGVAIVHQKYPFYKAYDLAEKLCSNAKKEGAMISPDDNGRNVSSIDWHIEFGEIADSIEEIRSGYVSDDGSILTNKPYVIMAGEEVINNIHVEKTYEYFKNNISMINKCEKDFGDGKVKQLRGVMKKGVAETDNYLSFYKLGDRLNASFYRDGESGKNRNPLFDAIEMMDTFFFV